MGLCTQGATGASLLYSLGGADKHWDDWFDLHEDMKIKLRPQIRQQMKTKTAESRGSRSILDGIMY